MARCLELAEKGMGAVVPNPLVGCVIVHEGKIIGEGYHGRYGEAHAEVNAISSVRETGRLADSTLYVNLEPCSHHGKTPPCSSLILEKKIPKLVVGTADPNPRVSGAGIEVLEKAGVRVKSGVLEKECRDLNRRFFKYHRDKKPWIILKWARTRDGFIDRERTGDDPEGVNWITGPEARQLVHRWRSEEQAILVGTRTVILDNPELTVRDWKGKNPLRLVIDREGKLSPQGKIFNNEADSLVFTSKPMKNFERVKYITVPEGSDYIEVILKQLYAQEIQSLIVEGGAQLLDAFIQQGLWDEARIFTGSQLFGSGIPSPEINGDPAGKFSLGRDLLEIYRNS